MPKQPIDYSKSIIYKIISNNPDVKEVYVGSTTDFKSRKNRHKINCNYEIGKEYNRKLYKTIRDNGGWDNFMMIPISEYPCENRIQLLIKEEEHRKELNAELNMVKCHTGLIQQEYQKLYRDEKKDELHRKKKDYREKNRDKILEKKKKDYETNKEKILLQQKDYYERNKDNIKEKMKDYREKNKDKIKEEQKKYTNNNKEKKKEYDKIYREKNKDKINILNNNINESKQNS
jgi:hypothetical protein